MAAVSGWKDVFCRWPAEMPRRGIVVASFGEQIPFSTFSTSETFLLLERQAPDATGARTILLSYDKVLALKIVDVVKARSFQAFGFDIPATLK
jgi:hypothetical protein